MPSPAVFPQPSAAALNPVAALAPGASAAELEKISKCSALVAKAVRLGGSPGKRQGGSQLLATDEEFELGYFLADTLTSALVAAVQNKIKTRLFDKMGTGAGAALDSMTRQLDMVTTFLIIYYTASYTNFITGEKSAGWQGAAPAHTAAPQPSGHHPGGHQRGALRRQARLPGHDRGPAENTRCPGKYF